MVLPLLLTSRHLDDTLWAVRRHVMFFICCSFMLESSVTSSGWESLPPWDSRAVTWFRECHQSLSFPVPLKNWHSFLLLSLIISCQTTWRFHKQLNQLKRGCDSLTSVHQTQMVWGRKDVVWRWNYKKMGNPKTWDYIYTYLTLHPGLIKNVHLNSLTKKKYSHSSRRKYNEYSLVHGSSTLSNKSQWKRMRCMK